jgi:DNA-binding NtrC family response regulator
VISAARGFDPEVPAALLTGYATKETADEAASRGIGVMFKPIEIDEFLSTTANMVRRNNEPKQEGGEKANPASQSEHQG